MPSRKQRRRQAKERRHEYEYVYVDEEGQGGRGRPGRARGAAERQGEAPRAGPRGRGGRTVQPPSWQRVGKRALIFAPLMFITVYLLGRRRPLDSQGSSQTFVLLAIFLPFSYVMDTLTYRAYQRRLNRDQR